MYCWVCGLWLFAIVGVVRCYGCLLIFAGAADWNFWWGVCCSVGFGGYLLDFVWVVRLFSVFLF